MSLALNVKAASEKSKYLGLPLLRGNSKKESLAFIFDKVLKNLKAWNQKLLSFAGREILVKVVIQVTPVYAMSRPMF